MSEFSMAAAVSAVTANMLTDWGALVLGSGPEPSRITENGPPSRLDITVSIGVDSALLELGLGVELLGPARVEGSNSRLRFLVILEDLLELLPVEAFIQEV